MKAYRYEFYVKDKYDWTKPIGVFEVKNKPLHISLIKKEIEKKFITVIKNQLEKRGEFFVFNSKDLLGEKLPDIIYHDKDKSFSPPILTYKNKSKGIFNHYDIIKIEMIDLKEDEIKIRFYYKVFDNMGFTYVQNKKTKEIKRVNSLIYNKLPFTFASIFTLTTEYSIKSRYSEEQKRLEELHKEEEEKLKKRQEAEDEKRRAKRKRRVSKFITKRRKQAEERAAALRASRREALKKELPT